MNTTQLITQELSRYTASGSFSWDGCTLSRQSSVQLSDGLTTVRSVVPGSFELRVNDDEKPTTVWLDTEQAEWLHDALTRALASRTESADDGANGWPSPLCHCEICASVRNGEVVS